MRRFAVVVLAVVFVAALLSYTVTYTVRFTERAVLTTFGKAGEGAIKEQPGLKFKWPSPIQSVTKYDTRLRFLQARSQTQQTADNRQIVVEAYCTWRVADPLKFFQRFSNAGDRASEHYRKADETLQSALRSAIGATSRYPMTQLFSAEPGGTKLPALEKDILTAMTAVDKTGESLSAYGVKVEDVGINRVVLPEETTKAVFERMGTNRERLAQEIIGRGDAEAQGIRSTAEMQARNIRSFADARAQEIRNIGDEEAAEYLSKMKENPELAVFLKNMEFLREVLAKRITLVLPQSTPGLELVPSDSLNNLKAGQVPVPKIPGLTDPKVNPDAHQGAGQ